MKIVLVTYGSRGDVQPMLALSLALQARGHRVLLAGPPEKADWASELGCPYVCLGEDVTAFVDSMPDSHSIRSALQFIAFVRRGVTRQFDLLPDLVSGADLVVGSALVFALASVADAAGIPYRYIVFAPQLLPSGGHPFPAIQTQNMPFWINRLTWQWASRLDLTGILRQIKARQRKMGLKPAPDVWQHILTPRPIVASDAPIAAVPEDTLPGPVQTGYMHLDQSAVASQRLAAFLQDGPPPVYAGFGSMPAQDQIRAVDIVVEAARNNGLRVVIANFWEDATPYDEDADVYFIHKYPHLHLFPHMAAVIHHGGAGTTAAAAISGCPQIIVPHILDQYYWGHRIHTGGLGPRPIPRAKLSAPKLARALKDCLTSTAIKQTTAKTAALIQQTRGVDMTAAELMKL